jgi:branched-chain amino acid transport system permease protein
MVQDLNRATRTLAVAALLAFAFALPSLADAYTVRVACVILVMAIFATGLNLILGFGGLLSFGHAAMFGTGAYVCARLLLDTGLPFLVIAVISVLASGLFGLVVGVMSWRVGGDHLALITLGVGQIFYLYLNNAKTVTGGATGLRDIPVPSLFGFELGTIQHVYAFAVALMALTTVLASKLSRSFFGRALLVIREDEIIARAHGINVPLTKVAVFGIGSMIAGLAGVVQVLMLGYVGPATFNVDQSIVVVEIILIGGMATTAGPLLGSIVVIGSTEYLRALADYRQLVFGALILAILLGKPGGVAQLLGLDAHTRGTPRLLRELRLRLTERIGGPSREGAVL